MSEIDQQFIEYVVKSLVGKPDAVHIDRRIDEKGVLLELTVDPEDLGRVIGKRGATAQSLRTLLRALGTKNEARYNLKIIDNGEPGHGRPAPEPSARQDDSSSDDSAADDTGSSVAPPEEPADKPEAPAKTTSEEPKVESAEEPETPGEPAPEESANSDEDGASDRLAQTRKELADLDDLDL